jgi:hypothetical protein
VLIAHDASMMLYDVDSAVSMLLADKESDWRLMGGDRRTSERHYGSAAACLRENRSTGP